jgi:hypothetical protein
MSIKKSATVQSASIVASGTGAANCLTINVSAKTDVAVNLSGTWVATVLFESSIDGTIWVGHSVKDTSRTAEATQIASIAANATLIADVTHVKYFRARCSAYTSGTIVAAGITAIRGGLITG